MVTEVEKEPVASAVAVPMTAPCSVMVTASPGWKPVPDTVVVPHGSTIALVVVISVVTVGP
jgi:hypothetical protein